MATVHRIADSESFSKACQSLLSLLAHPLSPEKALLVEALVETGDDNFIGSGTGMDKFVITDIDTDMVDDTLSLFGGIKKDKISRVELLSADLLADFSLLCRGAGKADTVFVTDVAGKAGTVESLGAVGAPDIFFAKMFLSFPE